MAGKCLGIAQIVRDVDQLQSVQHPKGCIFPADKSKGKKRAAIRHLARCQLMLWVACQSRIT